MSIIDEVLSRYGLRWELHPYRIVVEGRWMIRLYLQRQEQQRHDQRLGAA